MSHSTPNSNSNTIARKKDRWNTPAVAINDAMHLIGMPFGLDAAAEDKHAKCKDWITPEQDALRMDWITSGAVWCNPPFSLKIEFLQHAFVQAKQNHQTVCMMIPFEPGTKWWRESVSGKATFVYIPDGRYNFLDADTQIQKGGCNFVTCFVVYTPFFSPTQFIEFDRGIGNNK